jgi:hypothetical protein
MLMDLDPSDGVSGAPDTLAARHTDPLQLEHDRGDLFGDWQRDDQHAIAIRRRRETTVDRRR